MAGYPPFYPVHAYMPPSYIAAPIPPSTPISTLALDNHWVEHTAQDGRKYYYNNSTKQTSWEKPEELKTASEKILDACPWKEFKSENGRTYFYNTITKQSIWVKPHELADAENKAAELNNTLTVVSAPAKYNITAPITPLTPKDTSARPSEPSEIELAMKATLASIEAESQSQDSTQIPLPLNEPVASSKEDEDEEEEEEGQVLEENKVPEYKTRGEMAEGLRTLFRDKNIPGNSTWEQALRLISDDPRYAVLRTFSEKKQIFNVYKTQKQKEEREEQRLKAKKAKEDLEKFLLQCPKIHSTLSYMKINNLLSDASEWAAVPERDKREIYEDVVQEVAKREKEEAKSLRKRNIVVFKEILETMPDLTYQTTWSEAQQLLLENTKFTSDAELQSLDKEDALICFEEHIRLLEQEHDEEKERERRRQKRLQRKHREAFLVLLNELHKHQKLTSISLWKDLFYVINRDERFDKMLAQRGSTPLDLFKFYVESLKARLPAEKKIIKEILKDRGITVELSTSFDNFMEIIQSDLRSEGIDFGNARLTYESLIEKARGRERERQREDARRLKRLEQAFCDMLRAASDPPVRVNSPWEEIRDRFQAHPSYQALPLESERIRVYKEFILDLEDSLGDQESDAGKRRKDKRRRDRSGSDSVDGDNCLGKRKKRGRHGNDEDSLSPNASRDADDISLGGQSRKKKKSKKNKKHKKQKQRNASSLSPAGEAETVDMNETRRSYHHHHHHHHHYRNQFAVTSDISKSGSLNMSSMHASTAALAKIIEGSGIGILGAGSRKYRQAAEVRDREEDLEEGEAIDEDEEDEESEEVEDDDDGDRIDGIRDTNKIRNGGNGSPCRDQHISILCKHSGAKRAPYRVEGRAQGNVPDARDIEEDGEDERNDGKRNRSGVGVCAITDSDEMSDDSYNQKQRKKHHRS